MRTLCLHEGSVCVYSGGGGRGGAHDCLSHDSHPISDKRESS